MAKKKKRTIETVPETTKPITTKKKKDEYVKINFKHIDFSKNQNDFIKKIINNDVTFVFGPAGSSKAQPLYSKILTKNGWVYMKDIKKGDYIIGQDGKEKKVTGVFPFKEKMVYKVLMSDGSYTKCCEDHLWFTQTLQDREFRKRTKGNRKLRYVSPKFGSVKSLGEIKNTLKIKGRYNHYIPLVEPIDFAKKELLINPYIMGLLLGDGCFINPKKINVVTADDEIANYVLEEFKNDNDLKVYISKDKRNGLKTINFSKNTKCITNKIFDIFKNFGLHNKNFDEKFIPNDYLFSSLNDRFELLCGLMDTDGYVSKYSVAFTTASNQLMKDITFLVNSFGGTVSVKKYNGCYKKNGVLVNCKYYYVININLKNLIPFKLKRKKDKVKIRKKYFPIRRIVDVIECGKEPVQCISIDSPDGLYITDDFIVTHNTFSACHTALQLLQEHKFKQIIITKPIQESGEKLGFLPGNIEEKVLPYLESFYGNIEKIIEKEDLKKLIENEQLVAKPLAYLRGATFDDCIMILDEAQNCDFRQLMLYISRMGNNTKVIIAGDVSQYDIEEGYIALPKFIEMIKDIPGIAVHEFGRSDIVRNPLLIEITDRYEDWKRKNLITPPKKNGNGNGNGHNGNGNGYNNGNGKFKQI